MLFVVVSSAAAPCKSCSKITMLALITQAIDISKQYIKRCVVFRPNLKCANFLFKLDVYGDCPFSPRSQGKYRNLQRLKPNSPKIVTLKQVFFIFLFFQKGLVLILTKHFTIILQSFTRYRDQCCNFFTAVIYCDSIVMPSCCVIKLP
jgi:hypothetical protein